MRIFSYDSAFMTALRRLVDHILLGIVWIVMSLPVFTIGAATTAMLFTAEDSIRKEGGRILPTFWRCFRREFRQATLLWLLAAVLLAVLACDIFVLFTAVLPGFLKFILSAVVVFVFSWIQLWFGYLAKFQDTNRVLLHNTIRIVIGSLPKALLLSIISFCAIAGMIYCFLLLPPFTLVIPGIYGMLSMRILSWIFKKYLPPAEAVPADA